MNTMKTNGIRFGCCGSMISPATDPVGVEIVDSLARFGFDYIELSLSDLMTLPEAAFAGLKRRIEHSGIRCEACNNFFPPRVRLTGGEARLSAALDYARQAIERAAALGAQIIVFGSSGAKNVPPSFPKDAAWKQLVTLLQALGPLAEPHKITIAIEHLNRQESNIVNLAAEGLLLAHEVNHPNVQLLIDYYHLMMEREESSVILEAGAAVRHVHFARAVGRSFPTEAAPDFGRFFERLRQARYHGRCSVEAYTRDFAADAPRAIQLLRALASQPIVPKP